MDKEFSCRVEEVDSFLVESPSSLIEDATAEFRREESERILQFGSVSQSYITECALSNQVVGCEFPGFPRF